MSQQWHGHDGRPYTPLHDDAKPDLNSPLYYDMGDKRLPYTPGANLTADEIWAAGPSKERRADIPPRTAERSSPRKKWIILGVTGAFLVIVIGIAIALGVVLSVDHSKDSRSDRVGTTAMNGGGNDPSKFDPDPRLHQVFWGMAYDPQGSIVPDCGATQANVTRDIQILSQLTTRLRLYSSNCNILDLIMTAIQDTKVNMTITPAIYLDQTQDQYFTDQLGNITAAIDKFGTDMIDGIAVGNEFLLNSLAAVKQSAGNTGSVYTSAVASLAQSIQTVNSTILAKQLPKHIPIGTGDAGACMSTDLAEHIDFYMANVHPWFGALPIDQAAAWTWDYFQGNDVTYSTQSANKPAMYIAETGWPSQSMWSNTTQDGAGSPAGDASVANLQTFLDTFVCQANTNNTQYYYFEPFDEPWKAIYGGVEPFWGLFDSERNLKDITIPTCT